MHGPQFSMYEHKYFHYFPDCNWENAFSFRGSHYLVPESTTAYSPSNPKIFLGNPRNVCYPELLDDMA